MDWAKVYIEMPTDVKLLGRSVSDKWLWTCLILRAHDNNQDRGVVPHDEAEPKWLAKLTGVPAGTIKLALTYFERRGMTRTEECGLRLINYGKRQHRKPSDEPEAVRKRVAEHRSNTNVTPSVTPQKNVSNAPPSRERPTESRDQSTELTPEPNGSSSNRVGPDIDRIYRAWLTAGNWTPADRRLTPARQEKIRLRLKRFPVADVLDAVQGWVNDPWPDRPRQADLTLLLRNDEQCEKFRDMWRQGPVSTQSDEYAAAIRKYAEMPA